MDIKSTIDEIRNGLTGDAEKDMPYLAEQQKKYLHGENSVMIQRGILQMMFELLPEKDRAAMEQAAMENLEKQVAKTLECDKLFNDGQYVKSLKLADELIDEIHEIVFGDPDDGCFSFNEQFEYLLYKNKMAHEDAIYNAPLPVAEFYLRKANNLYYLERYMEAREMIADALRWNPVNADAYLDDADCLAEVGDSDEGWEQVRKAHSLSYTLEMLSRSYSCAANLLLYDDKRDDAVALLWAAVHFSDEDDTRDTHLSYLEELGISVENEPDWEKVAKTCEEYGLRFGADEFIIELAVKSGESAAKQGAFDDAVSYYGIAYELTEDANIAKILEELESKREN